MSSTPITREQWKLMAVLSLFWGTLFGALGIFFPYYSLYLKEDLGLTGQQVGTAMGVQWDNRAWAHTFKGLAVACVLGGTSNEGYKYMKTSLNLFPMS